MTRVKRGYHEVIQICCERCGEAIRLLVSTVDAPVQITEDELDTCPRLCRECLGEEVEDSQWQTQAN